ncbi:MAG: HAD-IB family phosphatase, partial [bacterium]
LEGDLPYTSMVHRTIARWAGRPAEDFLAVLRDMPLRPSALAVLASFRSSGAQLLMLSSGVHWWEQIWRERWGTHFDGFRSNVVEVDAAGRCTGNVVVQVTDDAPGTNKGDWLRRFQAEWGIGKADTIAFGDGTGDIPLFEEAGESYCLSPTNDKVINAASRGELVSGDFLELRDRLPQLALHWPQP